MRPSELYHMQHGAGFFVPNAISNYQDKGKFFHTLAYLEM